MTFQLVVQKPVSPGRSPYRLLDEQGRELTWANAFLDAQRLRQLSLRSLRAYGYDLLHLARWMHRTRHPLAKLDQAILLEYVRYQLDQKLTPTPATINHRLTVVGCVYRFHYGHEIPGGKAHFHRSYTTRSPLGYGRRHRRVTTALRLRQPHYLVVPLSAEQVAAFWKSFRTFRDLAIVALMLLDGLRSCEILQLQLEDLSFSDGQLRVLGKGNKKRVVPLPPDIIDVLQKYLRYERLPNATCPFLFLSWKGPSRGLPMTAAGLRSLFRHHRHCTKTPQANPHRFRHTFGYDMVRAGLSLPALMHLMGHSDIQVTMRYVQLAPKDVWDEYARAVAQRCKLPTPEIS